MMDNKLSELSKPVFEIEISDGYWLNCSISPLQPRDGAKFNGWPDGVNRLYSQEYVSALLAELEAKDKRIAELEAKLATPKPPEKCPTCNRRYTLESYAHGECAICGDPFDANDALRSMGFTVEGDE
ncbi:hypothetical protein SM14VA5_30410 [Serratia marcescens]|nr:hypothetical protein SM14VA5_30410 [Serratia marcescens]